MEEVSIPVSGEKYVWVKNKDASKGKVVLHTLSLLGVVSPKVISGGVEEYVSNVPDSDNFFLSRESVEEWGYDIREYSAYTVEDTDKDEDKYVWYTTSASRRYALYKQGHYGISLVALDDSVDAGTLVGNPLYMLSEEEVDNSVFDPDKFLAVGKNGLLVRGEVQEVAESPSSKGDNTPTSTPARKPQYKMSDKFDKLHSEDIVVITIANKGEADILASLLPIDCEYHVGDSDEDTSDSLLVYPEHTEYDADFTTLERHFGNPIITFAEAVVELSPTPFSTDSDGDANDVISAPYVTANGTALDLSHTPIGTGELPTSGITSAKITVGYRLTDKFNKMHRDGIVAITVGSKEEADILAGLLPIDNGYLIGDSEVLIVYTNRNGYDADFSAKVAYFDDNTITFEDAVEPV